MSIKNQHLFMKKFIIMKIMWKKFTLMEMLIAIPFFAVFVIYITQLVSTIYLKKMDYTTQMQRINISNFINGNYGSLVCYFSDKWAEKQWYDSQKQIKYNEKEIWTLNSSNTEWENELCEMLKASFKEDYNMSLSKKMKYWDTDIVEPRIIKHWFIIRTQVMNIYTYKLITVFALDYNKDDAEHIKRYADRAKEGWWDYHLNLMQNYTLDFVWNILNNGSTYKANSVSALNKFMSNIKQAWAFAKFDAKFMKDHNEKVSFWDFWYVYNKINFNLIDDYLIDKSDYWFPYNQVLIQWDYQQSQFGFRDYYIFRNGQ